MKNQKEQSDFREGQMIYGIRPVMEAVEAGKEIERIFINREGTGEQLKELKKMLRNHSVIWQEVPVEKLNRLMPRRNMNHQDVVCFISHISYAPVEEVIQSC